MTTATGITPLGVQQLAQNLIAAKQQQKAAAEEAAVISILAQIVTAVIQEVVSAGGFATPDDQAELQQASADAAIIGAVVTVIQQVPTLFVLSEIVECKTQNAAAGLPGPNQLTRAQLNQIVSSLPAGDARNARLVNDLKKLLSTVRPRN